MDSFFRTNIRWVLKPVYLAAGILIASKSENYSGGINKQLLTQYYYTNHSLFDIDIAFL